MLKQTENNSARSVRLEDNCRSGISKHSGSREMRQQGQTKTSICSENMHIHFSAARGHALFSDSAFKINAILLAVENLASLFKTFSSIHFV